MPSSSRRNRTLYSAVPALALSLGLIAGCSAGDNPAAPAASTPAAQTQQAEPSAPSTAPADVEAMLAKYELTGKDAKAIIDELERTHDDKEAGLMGSVRQDQLVLRDDSGQVALPMPADQTYISIAPYTNRTHDCFFHSLATCQGEMVEQPVTLKFTDGSGAVIAQEESKTYINGFVGLWLPRDVNGQIEITAGGKSATAPLSTAADAPTCVTTIKLS